MCRNTVRKWQKLEQYVGTVHLDTTLSYIHGLHKHVIVWGQSFIFDLQKWKLAHQLLLPGESSHQSRFFYAFLCSS